MVSLMELTCVYFVNSYSLFRISQGELLTHIVGEGEGGGGGGGGGPLQYGVLSTDTRQSYAMSEHDGEI